MGAVNLLHQVGIELHAGAPAIDIDEVVKQYLDGTIQGWRQQLPSRRMCSLIIDLKGIKN